jgi:hypothetical protein
MSSIQTYFELKLNKKQILLLKHILYKLYKNYILKIRSKANGAHSQIV